MRGALPVAVIAAYAALTSRASTQSRESVGDDWHCGPLGIGAPSFVALRGVNPWQDGLWIAGFWLCVVDEDDEAECESQCQINKGTSDSLAPDHTAGCNALTCICAGKGTQVIADKEPGNGDHDGWCYPAPLPGVLCD